MSIQPDQSYCADPHAEINVTPLIDVMLALVVVFMIAAPLLVKKFTLPLGGAHEPSPATETVHLGIGTDGTLSWNDRTLMPALLREQLRILAQRSPQPELRIEVARDAAYQSFATVLADAKAANVEKIGVLGDASR
jgi:biopolymer transport protein ExbD